MLNLSQSYPLQSGNKKIMNCTAVGGNKIRRTYHHITQELRVSISTNGRIPWRGALPFTTAIHFIFAFGIGRNLQFFFSSWGTWFCIRFCQYYLLTVIGYYGHQTTTRANVISIRRAFNCRWTMPVWSKFCCRWTFSCNRIDSKKVRKEVRNRKVILGTKMTFKSNKKLLRENRKEIKNENLIRITFHCDLFLEQIKYV